MRERIESAFAGVGLDRDVLEELAQHAESTYQALRADGLSEPEASERISALIAGWRDDPAALNRVVKRATVATPPANTSRSIAAGAAADFSYALRLMRQQPGSALVTILTIALGVAAVTTLFSVANGVLLSPLPWGDTERLVRITETRGGRQGRIPGTILNGSYNAWEEAPQLIETIGAYWGQPVTMTGAGEPVRVETTPLTPSMLAMLRATPIRGRLFEPGEGKQGDRVTILSYGLWEQRFGLRDDIVGQPVVFDGAQYTIVGVMPREFRFPIADTRAWTARQMPPVDQPNGVKTGTIMRAIARLKPDVTPEQANAEGTARAIAGADAGPVAMSLFGARGPIQISVQDVRAKMTEEVRPAILILLLASVLLFATAIANVANMQLARATARQRELTIRAALGAGTGRLARQLLIENGVIGTIGAIGGLLATMVFHRALPSVLPADFPRADAIAVDGRVLMVTLLLSVIAAVACGVLPLLHARKLQIARALSETALASAGAGRTRTATVRALIVASQVAVTCVLVIGATLLTRSFVAYMSADRGYDPRNLLTASIPFPQTYNTARKEAALRLLDRFQDRPGITHAAMSTGMPLVSAGGYQTFQIPSPRGGTTIDAESIRRVVTPGYFGAMGMRLRAGRLLTDADDMNAQRAVVVNRSFVRKYFDDMPIEQAIGVSLGTGVMRLEKERPEAFVVGVVDDLKQDAPDGLPQPEMFVPYAQLLSINHGSQAFILLRTSDDPAMHVESLRTALREEDPTLALEAVMTMDERIGRSAARPRAYAALLGGFAVFALIIAGAGLFGVLSYSVAQRKRELAVRSALGASRSAVMGVALRQIGIAMVAGLATGMALAAGLANNLSPFLFGVSQTDVLSFVLAPLALTVVGIVACIVPARRVAQTDPVTVLREV